MDKATIFVVDDDGGVRESLRRLLSLKGYRVETFASAAELLARLPIDADGCIVTDLKMPALGGLGLQEAVRGRGCFLPCIFISGHGAVPEAVEAMKGGAVDFLEKPVDPNALVGAIGAAIRSGRSGRKDWTEQESARLLVESLTPRERQVCEMAARGLLNKQIAAELGTSEKTVKAQRGMATRKLKVSSTAALFDLLRRANL